MAEEIHPYPYINFWIVRCAIISSSPLMEYGSCVTESKTSPCAGYLEKSGKTLGRAVKRFYVLKDSDLLYYETEKSSSPKRVIDLTGSQVMPFVPKGGDQFGFMLQTAEKTHSLFAPSEKDAQRWIDALSTAVNPPPKDRGSKKGKSSKSKPNTEPPKRSFSRAANKIEDVYTIGEELGTGGFSTVKRGVHKVDKTEWALKMIKNSVFMKNKERTEEEVAVLAGLSHPNIVQLKEVVRTPKFYVIVMELLKGRELFERIVERDKYNELDAKTVTISILMAVKYLHEHQIVHRDLKPENLIFDKPGEDATLKLTDFGFATMYDPKDKLKATCGTPEYVAPEILDEKPYDKSVDMWSVGVIVYILLCGFPPFYGDTENELFDRICRCKFKFLSPYWDPISDLAKDFVRRCLTLNPERRLTPEQALQHEWLSAESMKIGGVDLSTAKSELKRYNATRKFKKAIVAVIAANKMKNILLDMGIDGHHKERHHRRKHRK